MQHNGEKYTFNFNLFFFKQLDYYQFLKINPKVQTVLHRSSIHFNTPIKCGLDNIVTTVTIAMSTLFLPLDMVVGKHLRK